MTKPVTKPTPRNQRGQGRKRSKVTLRSGEILVKREATVERATVSMPERSAGVMLTFADGTQIELYPVK